MRDTEASFIKPTIGRKVYYLPLREASYLKDRSNDNDMVQFVGSDGGTPPLDATVVYVWNDICVNLLVTDHMGHMFRRQNVAINCAPDVLPRAEWMPYQKGQAAKTEQAQSQLEARIATELDKVTGSSESGKR
jgi:hypothetical protein